MVYHFHKEVLASLGKWHLNIHSLDVAQPMRCHLWGLNFWVGSLLLLFYHFLDLNANCTIITKLHEIKCCLSENQSLFFIVMKQICFIQINYKKSLRRMCDCLVTLHKKKKCSLHLSWKVLISLLQTYSKCVVSWF